MSLLGARGISLSLGGRALLTDVSFELQPGERVGLIGANGSGKSTFLRILAGELEPDSGTLRRASGLRTGFLRQEPPLDEGATVRDELEAGLAEFDLLDDELEGLHHALADSAPGAEQNELLRRQEELLARIEAARAWSAPKRLETMASRLDLDDLAARIGTLSMGWRKRVALGRMLLTQPDVLLLDEPTNHLDVRTIGFLEEMIAAYRGAVILVTHDRYVLDRVAERIVEIEGAQLHPYRGTYSEYLSEKARRLDGLVERHERRLKLIRAEEDFLKRTPQGRRGKNRARFEQLGELKKIPPPQMPREISLQLLPETHLGNIVLNTAGLTKRYGKKVLFRDVNLNLERGERIGIFGPNGCGKSTLLKVLLGLERPDAGTVEKGKGVVLSYFDQTREMIDPGETVYQAVNGASDYVRVGVQRKHIVRYLEDFLFTREDLRRPVRTLSGGERARICIARMLLEGGNLLLLDEPTNDLDIPTTQVLESALSGFPGCSLIVTHDRFFLDRIATSILSFEEDGRVERTYGNYTVYQRLRARRERERAADTPPPGETAGASSPGAKQKPAPRLFGYRQKEELERIEAEIPHLEEKLAALETKIADPDLYAAGEAERARELNVAYSEGRERLAHLVERWEELLRLQESERGG